MRTSSNSQWSVKGEKTFHDGQGSHESVESAEETSYSQESIVERSEGI